MPLLEKDVTSSWRNEKNFWCKKVGQREAFETAARYANKRAQRWSAVDIRQPKRQHRFGTSIGWLEVVLEMPGKFAWTFRFSPKGLGMLGVLKPICIDSCGPDFVLRNQAVG